MVNKNYPLVILNTITLLIMLFANFVAGSGAFGTTTVAEISHKYDTLFAPAGYAFTIWSFIFLFCIGFVCYQWVLVRHGDTDNYIGRTGFWFTISNLANITWLYCWTHQLLAASVIVILLLLLSLCILTVRLRLELDDEPVLTILFVWWPIVFYLGWIMVATIACIASWLVSIGWRGATLSEDTWTIIMIAAAGALYVVLVYKRNMREAALIGIWAFIAIAVRQWDQHPAIRVAALITSIVLLTVSGIHGYKNRDYSPFVKIKKGEWK